MAELVVTGGDFPWLNVTVRPNISLEEPQRDLLLPPPRRATLPGGVLHTNRRDKRVPDCMCK